MKKLYIDRVEEKRQMTFYVKDTEIINAGATVSSMSNREKNEKYEQLANEYDIHFIFDDNIPEIPYYTIPQLDIFAYDSKGGYYASIGGTADFFDKDSKTALCYIDNEEKQCYKIASNGKEFLDRLCDFKIKKEEPLEVTFYHSYEEASKEVEFIIFHKGCCH